MIKKNFLITVSFPVTFPFEESLLDGSINKNHLMYLACAEMQKRVLDPTKAVYEFYLREEDVANKKFTKTKL